MALSRGSKAFLVVLVVLVGGFFGALYAFNAMSGDEGQAGEPVTVEIPEGVGASGVADILAEAGVVDSGFSFRTLARFDDRANRIRPGTYELTPGMSVDEILDELTAAPPPVETFKVVIPEGLTVDETLGRIADAERSPFSPEELQAALVAVALPEWVPTDELPEGAQFYEGLLFPATYEWPLDRDAQSILAEMVGMTDGELQAVEPPDGFSRYEVLTIASLIEREVRVSEERALVSSVIYNRLAAPMRLQIDATIQYARGEHSDRVLFDDLEIDSAWNTYEADGLPPTPIAAAGRASIQAAAQPADTNLRFYVVCDTETGEHAFAEDDQGHSRNVAAYRQIQDEGGRVCED